jgi:hypothetical protein
MDESKPNVARKRHSGPFFTVPKRAMVAIREKVEGTNQTFCCAVYVALRWKANEGINHDGPFSAAVLDIAHRAGCCYRKTAVSLGILESIGVLGIEKQFCENKKTRSPSVFTFLLPEGTPLRTIGGTPYAQAEGGPVPRLEKEQKEQKEPKEPNLTPPKPESKFKAEDTEIPATLSSPEFTEAWADWCSYKRERKQTLSRQTAKAQIKEMDKWGASLAVASIRLSILRGWTGVFQPDANSGRAKPVEKLEARFDIF